MGSWTQTYLADGGWVGGTGAHYSCAVTYGVLWERAGPWGKILEVPFPFQTSWILHESLIKHLESNFCHTAPGWPMRIFNGTHHCLCGCRLMFSRVWWGTRTVTNRQEQKEWTKKCQKVSETRNIYVLDLFNLIKQISSGSAVIKLIIQLFIGSSPLLSLIQIQTFHLYEY